MLSKIFIIRVGEITYWFFDYWLQAEGCMYVIARGVAPLKLAKLQHFS